MGEQTLIEKLKDIIGSIAWIVFLWSINMSEDEYICSIVQDYDEDY